MSDPLYRAQLDLVNAQVDKVQTDADKGKTEGELLKKQLEFASKTLKDRIAIVTQQLNEKLLDVGIKGYESEIKQGETHMQEQKFQLLKNQVSLLAEQITSAKAVAKYADEYNAQKVEELKATINNLNADADVKEVEKELKKIEKAYKAIGININSELGQIGALILNSNSQPIAKQVLAGVKQMLVELISGLPDAIADIGYSTIRSAPSLGKKVIKKAWDAAKGNFGDFIRSLEKNGYLERYD